MPTILNHMSGLTACANSSDMHSVKATTTCKGTTCNNNSSKTERSADKIASDLQRAKPQYSAAIGPVDDLQRLKINLENNSKSESSRASLE